MLAKLYQAVNNIPLCPSTAWPHYNEIVRIYIKCTVPTYNPHQCIIRTPILSFEIWQKAVACNHRAVFASRQSITRTKFWELAGSVSISTVYFDIKLWLKIIQRSNWPGLSAFILQAYLPTSRLRNSRKIKSNQIKSNHCYHGQFTTFTQKTWRIHAMSHMKWTQWSVSRWHPWWRVSDFGVPELAYNNEKKKKNI